MSNTNGDAVTVCVHVCFVCWREVLGMRMEVVRRTGCLDIINILSINTKTKIKELSPYVTPNGVPQCHYVSELSSTLEEADVKHS